MTKPAPKVVLRKPAARALPVATSAVLTPAALWADCPIGAELVVELSDPLLETA